MDGAAWHAMVVLHELSDGYRKVDGLIVCMLSSQLLLFKAVFKCLGLDLNGWVEK